MKKKQKIRRRLPIKEVILDIKNYRSWIRAIKKERANPDSKYNKFGMNHNMFYILYMPMTLPSEDSALSDSVKRLRLMENLSPVHQYLDYELGFSEYIAPEFNQFHDEEDNPTLTYGAVYRFAFKKLSLKWILTRGLSVSLLIWSLFKWPILSTLWGFIF